MYKKKQMINMEKISKNILNILIIILLIIILLKTCKGGGNTDTSDIKVFRDTVWIKKDSTVITNPQLVKTIPYTVPVDHWNTEYLPDPSSMAILIKQYEALVRELLAKNIHSDSIKIDSIGHVYITDTVSKNIIQGRSIHYNLHYPVITNTITLPAPKKGQLYIGMGIGGVNQDLINKLNLGLMYKNKQDVMFGPTLSIEQNGTLLYGIQAFWKIKLHK
jgi:hypothetical protein